MARVLVLERSLVEGMIPENYTSLILTTRNWVILGVLYRPAGRRQFRAERAKLTTSTPPRASHSTNGRLKKQMIDAGRIGPAGQAGILIQQMVDAGRQGTLVQQVRTIFQKMSHTDGPGSRAELFIGPVLIRNKEKGKRNLNGNLVVQ